MIKKIEIKNKSNKLVTITRTIINTPTPGTLGDYWLLKDYYYKNNNINKFKNAERYIQLIHNEQFMEHVEKSYGSLHCEYCSKKVEIIHWNSNKKQNKNIISTVDHFLPKDKYPHLSKVVSNLFISCYRCNNNKKNNIVDRSIIKYEIPFKYKETFIFDKTKL